MFEIELKNIIQNKNKVFSIYKQSMCKSIKINYYIKKNIKGKKRGNRFKQVYPVLFKFESLFGYFPVINSINIKVKNKKKKARSINFIYLSLLLNKNFCVILNMFFIKNVFSKVFSLIYKKKFFSYTEELGFINSIRCISVTFKRLTFRFNYNLLYSLENTLYEYKQAYFNFNLNIIFLGDNCPYIFNILNVLAINLNKLLLFFYKYFRNRFIKI